MKTAPNLPKFSFSLCMNLAGRQANDFINWMKKKTGPPATTLEDVETAKTFIEKDDVVIVGFFKVRLLLRYPCLTGSGTRITHAGSR